MKSTLSLTPELAADLDCEEGAEAEIVVKGTVSKNDQGGFMLNVTSAQDDEAEDKAEPNGEEDEEDAAPPAPAGRGKLANPSVMAVIAAGKRK